jgi:hypothetical protein
MLWARMLAYITGTVDQELLLSPEPRRDNVSRCNVSPGPLRDFPSC